MSEENNEILQDAVVASADSIEVEAEGVPTAPLPGAAAEASRGRRTEKVGIVLSDKMQKSVVVRVDRLVKHPVYKRYVRKRTKFMAHNEIEGVSIGDQVRIVETRPLSARKRWRVVEVLRKASK
ncbi:MAG: 30S ribosomal protein S17 [Acidobacteria bacterium]|nr:30S ribosomal protein S17 [Acidobacteriota bacterium]MBI3424337.1 30S ribosomal protein S17 [Acidobacteriota bacterium]